MRELPPAVWMLKASTRNPLTRPSVWLKRKVIVLFPIATSPAGKFIFIANVWNPPPIPPYAVALPSMVTVLSLIAWPLFGVLLIGRVRFGWRGRSAVQWTLSGFAVLAVAYFGSKFVLEYLYGEHWG